jgi:hypothetical protein
LNNDRRLKAEIKSLLELNNKKHNLKTLKKDKIDESAFTFRKNE